MAKFRKKSTIEAVQFFGDGVKVDGVTYPDEYYIGRASVVTGNGRVFLSDGDWIITGADGTKEVCKPDSFEEQYEAVA